MRAARVTRNGWAGAGGARTGLLAWLALGVLACSGKAVVEGEGAGGGGASASASVASSSASSASATSSAVSSTSSGGGCSSHDHCPADRVCIFSTGVCAIACPDFGPCEQGAICDGCATSSCPKCDDCVGACAPAPPGQCDDHDDCPPSDVCIYGAGACAPACSDVPPLCADPNLVCDPCATSSCFACENCLGACTASF